MLLMFKRFNRAATSNEKKYLSNAIGINKKILLANQLFFFFLGIAHLVVAIDIWGIKSPFTLLGMLLFFTIAYYIKPILKKTFLPKDYTICGVEGSFRIERKTYYLQSGHKASLTTAYIDNIEVILPEFWSHILKDKSFVEAEIHTDGIKDKTYVISLDDKLSIDKGHSVLSEEETSFVIIILLLIIGSFFVVTSLVILIYNTVYGLSGTAIGSLILWQGIRKYNRNYRLRKKRSGFLDILKTKTKHTY